MFNTLEPGFDVASVESGRIQQSYQRFGLRAGIPLVCIGGPSPDAAGWQPVVDRLRDCMPVFVICGGVPANTRLRVSPSWLEEQADYLGRVIDVAAAGDPVNLLGFSWGSALAAQYAAKAPQRVHRLLLGSFVWHVNANVSTPVDTAMPDVNRDVRYLNDKQFVTRMSVQLPAVRRDGLRQPHNYHSLAKANNLEDSLIRLKDASRSWNCDLSRIQANTLIVHGGRDHLILPENLEMACRQIPDCSVTTIREAGHYLHLEHPGILSLYRRFIRYGLTAWAARPGRGGIEANYSATVASAT